MYYAVLWHVLFVDAIVAYLLLKIAVFSPDINNISLKASFLSSHSVLNPISPKIFFVIKILFASEQPEKFRYQFVKVCVHLLKKEKQKNIRPNTERHTRKLVRHIKQTKQKKFLPVP